MTEEPDLKELFSHAIDDGEMHADVLLRPSGGEQPRLGPAGQPARFGKDAQGGGSLTDRDVDYAEVPDKLNGFRCGDCVYLAAGEGDWRYCGMIRRNVSAACGCCNAYKNPKMRRDWEG